MKPKRLNTVMIVLLGTTLGVGLRLGLDQNRHMPPSPTPNPRIPVEVGAAPQTVNSVVPPAAVPRDQFQWTEATSASRLDEDFTSEGFQRWVQTDPVGALKQALGLADIQLQRKAVEGVMKELADFDLEQAKALFPTITHNYVRTYAIRATLETWIHKDREGAWAFIIGLPVGGDRSVLSYEMVRVMMINDHHHVAKMIEALPQDSFRDQLIQTAAEEWQKRDPQAAAEFEIRSLSPNFEHHTRANPIRAFAEYDTYAAINWLKKMAPGEKKNSATSTLFHSIAWYDLEASLDLLQEMEGEMAVKASLSIADRWSREDPVSASQWVARLSDENVQVQAAKYLALHWTYKDPGESVKWLATLAPGKVRDAAAESFVQNSFNVNTVTAMEWATQIGDETMRNQTLRWTANAWMIKDAPAAIRWIKASSSISNEMRAELLEN